MLSVCHQAFCACDCQVSCAQDVVSSLFCLFVAMIGMLGGCLVCAVLCFVVFLFHFTSVMLMCSWTAHFFPQPFVYTWFVLFCSLRFDNLSTVSSFLLHPGLEVSSCLEFSVCHTYLHQLLCLLTYLDSMWSCDLWGPRSWFPDGGNLIKVSDCWYSILAVIKYRFENKHSRPSITYIIHMVEMYNLVLSGESKEDNKV